MRKNKLIGLDIGGTKCAVCLGNSEGKPLDKIKFPTLEGFEDNWKQLKHAIYEILGANKISINDINAVGISCGGPLDSAKGIILHPPNLPDWNNIPIVKIIEDEFNIPAFLMNDANACALAEWQFGAGKAAQNMIFLTMGTGLGAGLILNGRIYEGSSGMGGEIGHIRLRKTGPVGFGKNGSFEGFCGGNGIAAHAEMIASDYYDQNSVREYLSITGEKDFSVKNLDIAQSQGNKFASYIFEKTGFMLGEGLAILIDSFNPEKIVIGSIFERCENLLRPHMEKVLRTECLMENLTSCKILPAALGDRIGDYACLLAAKYGFESNGLKTGTYQNYDIKYILDELVDNYPDLNSCLADIQIFF